MERVAVLEDIEQLNLLQLRQTTQPRPLSVQVDSTKYVELGIAQRMYAPV
jgi:hypothetical protein